MIDATDSSSPTDPAPDPTLDALVPKRSTGRNVALAAAALGLLAVVWASPAILRPSVAGDGGGGTWSAVAPHDQVLTVVRLAPSGWPYMDIEAVDDVPGAAVVGAWVLPDGDYGLGDGLDPGDYPDGLDFVNAALGTRDRDASTHLPQRLDQDGPVQLVTLWDITDCAVLDGRPPTVMLQSALGTTVHEELDGIASPGFDLQTLTETGICPG